MVESSTSKRERERERTTGLVQNKQPEKIKTNAFLFSDLAIYNVKMRRARTYVDTQAQHTQSTVVNSLSVSESESVGVASEPFQPARGRRGH